MCGWHRECERNRGRNVFGCGFEKPFLHWKFQRSPPPKTNFFFCRQKYRCRCSMFVSQFCSFNEQYENCLEEAAHRPSAILLSVNQRMRENKRKKNVLFSDVFHVRASSTRRGATHSIDDNFFLNGHLADLAFWALQHHFSSLGEKSIVLFSLFCNWFDVCLELLSLAVMRCRTEKKRCEQTNHFVCGYLVWNGAAFWVYVCDISAEFISQIKLLNGCGSQNDWSHKWCEWNI